MGISHIKKLNRIDIIILIILFIILLGVLFNSIHNPIITNPAETIGKVVDFERRGKVRVAVYKYTVDGNIYLVDGYDDVFNGDLFIVEYDPKKPERARVISHKPALPPNDSIGITVGTIIDRKVINRTVTFQYLGGGYDFERLQKLPPSESIISNKYSIGNRINIEYSVDNPNLARIRFE